MDIVLIVGDSIKADGQTRVIQGFKCYRNITLIIMKSNEGTFQVEKDAIFSRLEDGSAEYISKENNK